MMMEGVTLLSEATKYNDEGTVVLAFMVGLIAILFIVLAIGAFIEYSPVSGVACLIIAAACVWLCIGCVNSAKNSKSYKEYKVTIDDSVKMNEFYDRYTIVGHEGKIYTITEIQKEKQ